MYNIQYIMYNRKELIKMLNILLVPNTEKQEAIKAADTIFSYLLGKANPILYDKNFSDFENIDVIIALGGDGTILETAACASPFSVPVLGINLGNLGFLADVEKHDAILACEKILNGNYTIEERMMLHAKLVFADGKSAEFDALNDFVISRVIHGGLADIKVLVDGEPIDDFRADGVIFATPTGSTAYSLSAGGPILDPALSAFLITPVCTHKIYSKAIVLPSEKEILACANEKCNPETMLIGDGRALGKFSNGDKLYITKSKLKAKLIKLENNTFYNTLKNKLMH